MSAPASHSPWQKIFLSACAALALALIASRFGALEWENLTAADRAIEADRRHRLRLRSAADKLREFALSQETLTLLFQARAERRVADPSALLQFAARKGFFSDLVLADNGGRVVAALEFKKRSLADLSAFRILKRGASVSVWQDHKGLRIAAAVLDPRGKFQGAIVARYIPPFSELLNATGGPWYAQAWSSGEGIVLLPFQRSRALVFPEHTFSARSLSRISSALGAYGGGAAETTLGGLDGQDFVFRTSGEAFGIGGYLFHFRTLPAWWRSPGGWMLAFCMVAFVVIGGAYVRPWITLRWFGEADAYSEIRERLDRQREQLETLSSGLRIAAHELASARSAAGSEPTQWIVDDSDEARYARSMEIAPPTPVASPPPLAPPSPLETPPIVESSPETIEAQVDEEVLVTEPEPTLESQVERIETESREQRDEIIRRSRERIGSAPPPAGGPAFIELKKHNLEFIYIDPFETFDGAPRAEDFALGDPAESEFAPGSTEAAPAARGRIFTPDLRASIEAVRGAETLGGAASGESTEMPGAAVPRVPLTEDPRYLKLLNSIEKFSPINLRRSNRLEAMYARGDEARVRGLEWALETLAERADAFAAALLVYDGRFGCHYAVATRGFESNEIKNFFFSEEEHLLKVESGLRLVAVGAAWREDRFFQKKFGPELLERLGTLGVLKIVAAEPVYVLFALESRYEGRELERFETKLNAGLQDVLRPFLPLLIRRAIPTEPLFDGKDILLPFISILKRALERAHGQLRIVRLGFTNYFDEDNAKSAHHALRLERLLLRNTDDKETVLRIAPNRLVLALWVTNEVKLLYTLDEANDSFFKIEREVLYYPDEGQNLYNYT